MRIISYNVNGLNSILQKGTLYNLVNDYDPDVICLQETKCSPDKLRLLDNYFPDYYYIGNCNQWKSGYAGVVTLIRKGMYTTVVGQTPQLADTYSQGRIVTSMFPGLVLINVYTLNSGGKDESRSTWDELFRQYVESFISEKVPVIIVGDLNVVSSPLDYWGDLNSKIDTQPGMKKYEILGFHNGLLRGCDLVDSYRELHPQGRDYSWFSYRGGARQKNHGWRIDYALCSKDFLPKIASSEVLSHITGSDHCPILIDVNNELVQ